MDHAASPRPPFSWVHKRDGRLVPFDAAKISQSLFAATETLGQPDAFLARELTDGVLHFLAKETEDPVPTTSQVAEMVVKIVRELGQPALAQAYADHAPQPVEKSAETDRIKTAAGGPSIQPLVQRWVDDRATPHSLAWRAAAACLRQYSLERIFTRDLVSAHRDGLLILGDLHAPLELAACVLGPFGDGRRGVLEAIQEARSVAGSCVAIDGPEYILAHLRPSAVPCYVRELDFGLRATQLRAIVNLNCAIPPPWAGDLAAGPLFTDQHSSLEPELLASQAESLLDPLLTRAPPGQGHPPREQWPVLRVDWHLNDRDFEPNAAGRLLRLARRASEEARLAFVFDRRRRRVSLGEGLERRHPAVLMTVGLNLLRLAEQAGSSGQPDGLLQKLGSLARLALTAATQKRDFLRRQAEQRPELNAGFCLERARLVVVPIGLNQTARLLKTGGVCSPPGLEFARQTVQRLRDVFSAEGRTFQLETCLDSAPGCYMVQEPNIEPTQPPLEQVAGLTPWDSGASVAEQLRAAGTLHGAAANGTAAVILPDRSIGPEEVVEWLRLAWEKTAVNRVCFVQVQPSQRHLPVRWEETASPA